ncbi:hypothetical protein MBLNU457_g0734t1 [Dothideomycetes sp. NU457]
MSTLKDPQRPDAHNAPDTHRLIAQAGVTKAKLPWVDLIVKSFLGGVYISMGALFDLIVQGGAPGLRASSPSLATLLGGLVFPVGFVLILLTNMELATSNMFSMAFSTLARKTTLYDLGRNWVVSYIGNLCGCLFFAGILTWWADIFTTDAEIAYVVSQAEGRVNINWGYNFSRAIGCNWLVGIALYMGTSGRDNVSKIYGIFVPITTFVVLGYQHCIANFFLIPIGMFYGTNFGVGKFIYNSVIPVTLGNIIGGAFFMGFSHWLLYGREPALSNETGQETMHSKTNGRGHDGILNGA